MANPRHDERHDDKTTRQDDTAGVRDARSGEAPVQLAATPQFPIQTETAHAAEFILSEANGHRSRANASLADPVTIKVAQPLKLVTPATATAPAVYAAAALGADCNALAIYGGTSNPTNGLRIAVLVRDAEVNGNLIQWGSIITTEQAIGLTTLAAAGIIARF